MRQSGATLDEVGNAFGLTRERVRQIVGKMGGFDIVAAKALRAAKQEELESSLRARLFAIASTGLARSINELSIMASLDAETVRRVGGRDLGAYLGLSKRTRVRWAQSDVISAVREAATYEWPLSRRAYQQLVATGEINGPSSARIDQLYGWSTACEMAGVERTHRSGRDYQSTWTDDDLWHFVQNYISAEGRGATFHGYDAWRAENAPEAPSSGVVRARLGKWNEIRRTALIEGNLMADDALTGKESLLIDEQLVKKMDDESRSRIWKSVFRILDQGPQKTGVGGRTGLALGYVQSGKTTSITALIAAAADQGYQIVVAMLGGTNLLLEQNKQRLEVAFGTQERKDYRWATESNPSGIPVAKRIGQRVQGGRTVFLPVLKHAGRLNALADVLEHVPNIDNVPVLIIDDEADQASLNTSSSAESKTYEAIRILRSRASKHLYVQYTATPYAPLMLDADDLLSPDFVEFLEPGNGYTGGREFFVESAEQVIRDVPLLDEQPAKSPPLELPRSLVSALGSFVAGAALLVSRQHDATPVSMLIHSTQRNDVQERYRFLVERELKKWLAQLEVSSSITEIPNAIRTERIELTKRGTPDVEDEIFLSKARWVLREISMWLLNTTSALKRVEWNVTPFHVLIGGNKLDRGFTVEGLTVTYMNRPASAQVDTLEQRARAFGYRNDQLPYCQFFATKRTIRSLREIVFTEFDLRAQLLDHVDGGGTVHSWARNVGLMLPDGMKPTRDAVVSHLTYAGTGWSSVRLPRTSEASVDRNREIISSIGLSTAPRINYGRLSFRTVSLRAEDVIELLVSKWDADEFGPSWRRQDVLDTLSRVQRAERSVPVILMEGEEGAPRLRRWEAETGFVNLFQGRDNVGNGDPSSAAYPGDRVIGGIAENPNAVVIQVHRVARRDDPTSELFALAVHLGSGRIVRTGVSCNAE